MKHTLLNDKYPVFSLEIEKSEIRYRSLPALIDYFKEKIAENPKVQFLTVFDHFAHTSRIGGEIMPGLVGAVDIVFCFGFAIPIRWYWRCAHVQSASPIWENALSSASWKHRWCRPIRRCGPGSWI